MKLVVKIFAGIGLSSVITISFIAGERVHAGDNLVQNITVDATHELSGHAHDKTNELVNNVQNDVSKAIGSKVNSKVTDKESQVDKTLTDYYQQKINDIVNSEDLSNVDDKLNATVTNVLNIDEKEIDQAISDALGN